MNLDFSLKISPDNPSGKVSKPDRGKKDNPVFASRILKSFSSFFSPQKWTNGIREESQTLVKVEGSENVGNHEDSHASSDHFIEEAGSSARAQESEADPEGINDAADDVIDVLSGSDVPNDSNDSDVVEISGPNSLLNTTAYKARNAVEPENESQLGKSRNVPQNRISVTQTYSIESTSEPEEIEPGVGAHVSLRMDQSTALQSESTGDNLEARSRDIHTQEQFGSQSPGIFEVGGPSQRVLRPRNRPEAVTPESSAESGEETSDEELFIDAAETGSRPSRAPGKRPTRIPSGKYTCTYCGKQELCNSHLIRHIRKHTGEKPYGCKVCGKHFVSHSNRETHMSVHRTERPFACETCGKTFTRRVHLRSHINTHLGIRPFICTYCGKAFFASSNLQKHTRIHTGEKPHGCTLCHRSYASRASLVIHTLTHTGEKPFGCKICGKHFALARTLKIHTRVHTGERPYPCTLCEKRFAGSSALNVHMLTHTKERPHECVVCEKRFALGSNLSKHMRCHTGERPYKCTVCDRGYSSSIALRRHMGIHTEETPFECVLCGLKVSLKPTLAKHMKIHTGKRPYKCSECGEKVLQKEPMIAHLLTHKEEDGVDFSL